MDATSGGDHAAIQFVVSVEDPAQTCSSYIAANCKASILRVFPGQFLDSPVQDVLDAAKSGDTAARTARELLFDNRFRK